MAGRRSGRAVVALGVGLFPLAAAATACCLKAADLATELSAKGGASIPRIRKSETEQLEKMVDELQEKLPRLKSFILPGGSQLSSSLHLARAVSRRAERKVVTLSHAEKINPEMVPYFNRLSTLLFNLARYANVLEKVKDEASSP